MLFSMRLSRRSAAFFGIAALASASACSAFVSLDGARTTSTDGRVTAYARGDLTLTERDQWTTLRLGGSLQF